MTPKGKALRLKILEMCYLRGGHISTAFSCVEILEALYYHTMQEGDKFIMSKGHGEPALYAVLADLGRFPQEWLLQEYRAGSHKLAGHVDTRVPGVDVTTGTLGHGLSIACGMAWAGARTYCLLGDAECSEGSVWEAAAFAKAQKLRNLVAIVDDNQIGALDRTRVMQGGASLTEKFEAFGWHVEHADGHDVGEVIEALRGDGPLAVIASTVKGKGAKVFENDPAWHVRKISPQDYESAKRDLCVTP